MRKISQNIPFPLFRRMIGGGQIRINQGALKLMRLRGCSSFRPCLVEIFKDPLIHIRLPHHTFNVFTHSHTDERTRLSVIQNWNHHVNGSYILGRGQGVVMGSFRGQFLLPPSQWLSSIRRWDYTCGLIKVLSTVRHIYRVCRIFIQQFITACRYVDICCLLNN